MDTLYHPALGGDRVGYRLGVDLGTTWTAAAVARDGRVEMATLGDRGAAIPSVLFLRPDGELLVGDAALRRGLTEPDRLAREFKRRLGDPAPLLLGGTPMPADALMGHLLGWVVDHVTSREGERPERVTVTHPANWGPYKRELLAQAIARSGIEGGADTMTEPEAAAIHYASLERLDPGSVVAVYDLGGGTFDAAVLRKRSDGFDLLGTPEGLERTGGIDFDEAVFGHVADALGDTLAEMDGDDPRVLAALARLRDDCVAAKEALSSDTDVAIPVLLPSVQTEVRLTRGEFEAMIRPTLVDTVNALERALRGAGVDASDVHAVLLVGGSSRIPLVGELVTRQTGRPVAVDVHPKHAVALGAARGTVPEIVTEVPTDTVTDVATDTVTEPALVPASTFVHHGGDAPSPRVGGPPVAPTPANPPARSRRVLVIAVVAVLVVAVAVGAFALTRGGGGSSSASSGTDAPTTAPDSSSTTADPSATSLPSRVPVEHNTVSDGAKQFAVAKFAVPSTPFSVVVGAGFGWVVAKDEGKLMRIDPSSDQVTAIVLLGKEPVLAAFGAGSVWVSNHGDGTVTRVDAATAKTTATIPISGTPSGIAATDKAVWVARDDGHVVRIDPATNQVAAAIDIGGGAGSDAGMAVGGGFVWMANGGLPGLVRIEEATGRVDNVVRTGASPGLVTFGAGAVWVQDSADNTVTRVDPDRFVVTATIPMNESIEGLIVSGNDLWVSLPTSNTVVRVDAATSKIAGRVDAGQGPTGLGDGEGTVWVCDTNEGKVARVAAA